MDFILPVFPSGNLDSSVITTTWVGILVITFFNLRFGWVLSGLVVPGYLVPLIIIKPWSAAVIGVEAIATYLLVWALSEVFSRWGVWSSFFGRDRFFALILASIAVRVFFDGWILPDLGSYMVNELGISFDYRGNLHSFGLIIVALLANQFWKSGLPKAVMPVTVTLGLTWFLVRYGLMEFTNFRISDIGYLYEDLASSILASPKAYIILVVTAFLASRMNLIYGWEFNGILIPSLIALQWYQPMKIAASIVEALVIYLLAIGLLSLPLFKRVTIEGARKLLFFFNIGFAYKIALGFLLPLALPAAKVSDYFGFGYLLSTLIAVKIHDKDIPALLARATVQTSLLGVALASMIGFGLTLLPGGTDSMPTVDRPVEFGLADAANLDEVLAAEKIALYARGRAAPLSAPAAWETEAFTRGITALADYALTEELQSFGEARTQLARVSYAVQRVGEDYLVAMETGEPRGWGTYILKRNSISELAVEIPEPFERRGLIEGGLALFQVLDARAFALSGISARNTGAKGATPLGNRTGFFHTFHRTLGRDNAVIVRGYTNETLAVAEGLRKEAADITLPERPPLLWVKRSLPPGLNLARFTELAGKPDMKWGKSPQASIQMEESWGGAAELYLSRAPLRKLAFAVLKASQEGIGGNTDINIGGYLRRTLIEDLAAYAPAGSDGMNMPRLDELLFLDEEVLTALVRLLGGVWDGEPWNDEREQELEAVNLAAEVVGYGVTRFRDEGAGQDYLVLAEKAGAERRYWGSYVFRAGPAEPIVVEAPRPLSEGQSLEFALSFFERVNARGLMVTGAHRGANNDGSSNVLALANVGTVFNLVNQVLLRESDAHGGVLMAQVRGMGAPPPGTSRDKDLYVNFAPAESRLGAPALHDRLFSRLSALDFSVGEVDTSDPGMADLSQISVAQVRYLPQTGNGAFAVVWVSRGLRRSFRQLGDEAAAMAPFREMGIESRDVPLADWIAAQGTVSGKDLAGAPDLEAFLDNGDMARLWRFYDNRPRGVSALRLTDEASLQTFLVLLNNKRVAALLNLAPAKRETVTVNDQEDLGPALTGKSAWIVMGGRL